MDDSRKNTQDNWTATQWKYIVWLATPRFERTPPHQEMLAKDLGVNPATLWRWRKLPGFQEAVNAYAREMIVNKLPEVYGALLREAEKGSYQHIKLALELAGDYQETTRQEVSGTVHTTAGQVTIYLPDNGRN